MACIMRKTDERMIVMVKACAITGHRPMRFAWKYNESDERCKHLKEVMREQFAHLYKQGVRRFYVGGALGVDLWAGEILLRMKEQPEYEDIELVVALPFEGHDAEWDSQSRSRLQFLLTHSTETVVVGNKTEPSATCYKKRNYYMVENSNCLLAVYDNARAVRSGTGMTVNYAKSKGLPIILIHPDTGAVSGR